MKLLRALFSVTKVALMALDYKLRGKVWFLKVTEPQVIRRRAICAGCPHQVNAAHHSLPPLPYCDKCLCLLDVKTRVAFEKCPAGHW